MNFEFPGAVPEIPVTNLVASLAYYEGNLGFGIDWGGEDDGIAGISKGHCKMFLTNKAFHAHYGNAGPVMTWLNLDSNEDVDELFRLWTASHAKIVSPPASKPWGLYEFTVADPDGNMFRVFHDFSASV